MKHVGLKFPIELAGGRPLVTNDKRELIKINIRSILSYRLNQKFMDGFFGSRHMGLLGEPNDFILKNTLIFFIKEAIKRYEPRVEILEEGSKVVINQPTYGSISVILKLKTLKDNDEFTFILPIYNNPNLP